MIQGSARWTKRYRLQVRVRLRPGRTRPPLDHRTIAKRQELHKTGGPGYFAKVTVRWFDVGTPLTDDTGGAARTFDLVTSGVTISPA
jgi:hypothetical protein